ncbi:MAG TPA: signal peptidase I [Thermoanaerobaculia bacterium]|nr:signal peptidase I [Thermoanaerobaculia bacterium]
MKAKSTPRIYYELLLIAVIVVNFTRIFVIQAFKIPSGSMVDNLLIGDHIVVNKFVYSPAASALFRQVFPFRTVHRGDVVIFRYPRNLSQDFIKRVVALPGETILIRDKQIYIDGSSIREPWKVHLDPNVYEFQPDLAEPYRSRDQFGPYRIPEDSYFVLGDNRDLSHDSRYWGAVPRSLIKGRALLVYWSFAGTQLPSNSPPIERVRELFTVIVTFFEKTRWDRTFHVIDSSYHYDRGSDVRPESP